MPDLLEQFAEETIEDLLKRLPTERLLKRVPAQDRLKGLSVEDQLAALSPDARAALARRLKDEGDLLKTSEPNRDDAGG